MKKFRPIFLLVCLAAMVFFSSCDNDDEKPKGEFSSGVLVLNEGNFTEADGTVSHFDRTSAQVKQDVFGSVNNGKALGSVVQSLTVDGDLTYVVVNNSNKVEVVNSHT